MPLAGGVVGRSRLFADLGTKVPADLAQAVAAAAEIEEVISEALPAAKAQVITDLQAAGRSVAMVGDGVNDGPALAGAQLGLALGSSTDVAICAADIILLRDDLPISVRLDDLDKMCAALGCSVADLLEAEPLAAAYGEQEQAKRAAGAGDEPVHPRRGAGGEQDLPPRR